jgi:hypothetical protein
MNKVYPQFSFPPAHPTNYDLLKAVQQLASTQEQLCNSLNRIIDEIYSVENRQAALFARVDNLEKFFNDIYPTVAVCEKARKQIEFLGGFNDAN